MQERYNWEGQGLSPQHGNKKKGYHRIHELDMNKWVNMEQNVHFHLNLGCLKKNDAGMDGRFMTCKDEMFVRLDLKQMEILHAEGLLRP